MDVTITEVDGRVVVAPRGPVDSVTADELQGALLGAIGQGSGPVELDFSAVPYLSSAGLRVLVVAAKALRAAGGRLRVTGVQPPVQAVLELTSFGTHVDIAR